MLFDEESRSTGTFLEKASANSQYLELANFIPDGYLLTDTDCRILESNYAADSLIAEQDGSLLGKSILSYVAEGQQQLIGEQISQLELGAIDKLKNREVKITTDDESTISCLIMVSAIRDHEAKLIGFHWLIRDNSEQSLADEALWASERRFRSVADTASDAIIIFNNRLHLIYWNIRAKEVFRYPAGETMYKLLGSIVAGGFDDKLHSEIELILTTGQSELIGQTIEAIGIRQDGHEFPIEFTLATWQANDDIYFTIIIRDISDRKQAEQKLFISEKMASLGRLTAGIAHEINTPIAAIRASLVEVTELINEFEASMGDPEVTENDRIEIIDEIDRALELAKNSASRAARFVQSIRNQTRDPKTFSDHNFDAKKVVADSVMMLDHSFRKEKCSFQIDAPDEKIMLFGSPERFSQMVINLLSNAIDASAVKGGGPITLSLNVIESETVMQINDVGSGIKPNNIAQLFDPMFSTKPFGEGSGLGLTIVHDIVTAYFDGRIEVESELGSGTKFTVYFPHSESDLKE